MLFCTTSPKSIFVNQYKRSTYRGLTCCTGIILSILTVLYYSYIIIGEPKVKRENVDLNIKMMKHNLSRDSSFNLMLDSSKSSNNENNQYQAKDLYDSMSRSRRHDKNRETDVNSSRLLLDKFKQTLDNDKSNQNLMDMENMDESTSETVNRGTMMLASSRSGKFNKMIPLDDLVIKPIPETEDEPSNSREDIENPHDKIVAEDHRIDINRVNKHSSIQKPELIAPISDTDTVRLTDDIERASSSTANHDELALDDETQDENRYIPQPQSNLKPSIEPENTNHHETTMDQFPDSMDSLMNSSEQEDLADLSDENNPSASQPVEGTKVKQENLIINPERPAARKKLSDLDEDDYDDMINFDDERRPMKPVAKHTSDKDLSTAAGYHHSKKKHHGHGHGHDHGKYYMYAKVPKKKSWEFGYKRGNKKHWIERHEKGHKNKFKTKVKWYDKKGKGKGIHIWDYNHHDKKKKKHF